MPVLETTNFGRLTYEPSEVYYFPVGIPAFEDEHHFLLLEQDTTRPVIFLQSTKTPSLAFLTLPVAELDHGYAMEVPPQDRALLDTGEGSAGSLIALALLTVSGQTVTANLRAPVLLSPGSRRGVQSIPAESDYSAQHPVSPGAGRDAEAGAPCS